jgi:hypothetical protein
MVPGHALSWAGTYEAFAHIWVGVMLTKLIQKPQDLNESLDRKLVGFLLVVATILEVVMFMIFKRGL